MFRVIATAKIEKLKPGNYSSGIFNITNYLGALSLKKHVPRRRDGRSGFTLGPRKPLRWTVVGFLAKKKETQEAEFVNGWLVSWWVGWLVSWWVGWWVG